MAEMKRTQQAKTANDSSGLMAHQVGEAEKKHKKIKAHQVGPAEKRGDRQPKHPKTTYQV